MPVSAAPSSAPLLVTYGIPALSVIMAALAIAGVAASDRRRVLSISVTIIVVAAAQLALASVGILQHWDQMPSPFIVVVAATSMLTMRLETMKALFLDERATSQAARNPPISFALVEAS